MPFGPARRGSSPTSTARSRSAFLERYPAPADTRGLGEKRLEGFLARRSELGPAQRGELMAAVALAPVGRAGAMEAEARRGAVLGLVAALLLIVDQIRELTSQIAGVVRSHPDGQVFLPLFKDPKSVVTAARLVAEIGDIPLPLPDPRGAGGRRRHGAGGARVGQAQGRLLPVGLRQAIALTPSLALPNSRCHTHPACVYLGLLRAEGSRIPTRSGSWGRAWLCVLWRCWQNELPYDPAKHGNLRRLQPEGG